MNAIRIRRRLDSPIPELPELSGLVGKHVEIIVLEAENGAPQPGPSRFTPVGTWAGPPGEFERLMQDVTSARDADLELDRESRP